MDIEVNLIRRCKSYERAAFDTLLKKYEGYLYSICYGFTHNREESLDIMQEVFIKVFRSIPKFDEKRPFLPWLKRITVNTGFMRYLPGSKLVQKAVESQQKFLKKSAKNIAFQIL